MSLRESHSRSSSPPESRRPNSTLPGTPASHLHFPMLGNIPTSNAASPTLRASSTQAQSPGSATSSSSRRPVIDNLINHGPGPALPQNSIVHTFIGSSSPVSGSNIPAVPNIAALSLGSSLVGEPTRPRPRPRMRPPPLSPTPGSASAQPLQLEALAARPVQIVQYHPDGRGGLSSVRHTSVTPVSSTIVSNAPGASGVRAVSIPIAGPSAPGALGASNVPVTPGISPVVPVAAIRAGASSPAQSGLVPEQLYLQQQRNVQQIGHGLPQPHPPPQPRILSGGSRSDAILVPSSSPSGTLQNTEREGTPSTVIASDEESATGPLGVHNIGARSVPKPNALKREKAILPLHHPVEAECRRQLSENRKGRVWQHWEDLRMVRWLLDVEHPSRAAQLLVKLGKSKVPPLFDELSRVAFLGSRDAKSLFTRWGIIKKTFSVVHRLENATGGDGVADYVTDNPDQTLLEKLGERLKVAATRMHIENLKAPEYHAWVEDPVNGLYAILAGFLGDDVSVVRAHQYRSGAISPAPESSILDISDDSDVQSATSDSPGSPKPVANDDEPKLTTVVHIDSEASSRAGSATPTCATSTTPPRPAHKSRHGEKRSHGKHAPLSASFGLDFIRQTQSYQEARAEVDRQRLEVEQGRFRLEQANEERAEQRLQLERERIELTREEQRSVAKIADASHGLEVARLELARERNQDLKRKAELDEIDRLRTHKRLRAENITNTALQIQADKDDRYDVQLRKASQDHILAMFAQAREVD